MGTPSPQAQAAFQAWLREFRAYAEQTQAQFAQSIGVHRVTLANWERGEDWPSRDMRIMLNSRAREDGWKPIPPTWTEVPIG